MDSIPPLSVPYKDRKVGLVVFGILTILLGIVCLLFSLLMLLSMAVLISKPRALPANFPSKQIIGLGAGLYITLSIINIWLGIGSLLARRWARALLLIFSAGWLFSGVITVSSMVFNFLSSPEALQAPATSDPHLPPHFQQGLMIFTLAFNGVVMIVMPLIWTVFYAGKNVKATCEALDPVPRWTDRCPLPVLAASLWFVLWALCVFCFPLLFKGTLPIFGKTLPILPGMILYTLIALVWLYSAFSLYKLQILGWWMGVILIGLYDLYFILSFSHGEMLKLFSQWHLPEESLKMLNKNPLLQGTPLIIWTAFYTLLMVGYMIYIRKFFVKKTA